MNRELHLLRRSANRQIFNPTVIKHRNFDCHIATAKQCGTHWIKYLLSLVLCRIYDLPLPDHIRDDSVVGHTKNRPVYENIPQIAVTHSHPHYLLRMPRIFEMWDLPRFVVLVRDPRDILVSTFEKTKGEYLQKKMRMSSPPSFSEYLCGDVSGRRRIADIWDTVLFFNSWGAVLAAHEDYVLAITYEDMKKDTASILHRVCDHINIRNFTDDIIAWAVDNSSREKMRENLDEKEPQYEKSVNIEEKSFQDWYNSDDRAFVDEVLGKHLKYDFGYDFKDWS